MKLLFDLHHDAWGRLVFVDPEGNEHVGVEPVRDFPISDPKQWISLIDAQGRELACVEDPAKLSPEVRGVLEEALARREFVPVIHTIERITSDDPAQWTVHTDRGPTTFILNSEDDIRRLGRHRALIVDAFGIRYFISDLKKLDAMSRRFLERYL